MYPSQQSYMHAQVPQYSLRTISEDTIRSVPPNSGGSRPIAPPIFAASVPPTQTSVPSPARRPLPTPTLPYREHSQTLPVAVASGAESGQLPQFALNATQSQPLGSRKPLPRPPSMVSPAIPLSGGISTALSPDLAGNQEQTNPYHGKQLPQSATAFIPAWQQYRKLGGGSTKELSTNVFESVVPRRALPVPKQAPAVNSGGASRPVSVPPNFVPSRGFMSAEQEYKTHPEASNARSADEYRPASTSPPPPPLPPRPHLVQQGNAQSSASPNSSPSKESRKLPLVPQGMTVGARISAIESLKSMPPRVPEPQSVSSESIEGTAPTSGPITGAIASPNLNDRGSGMVTNPEHARGVTAEAAPTVFSPTSGGSLLDRKNPDSVPESTQRPPNAQQSNVLVKERRAASSERPRSPVVPESTQESERAGAPSSVKAVEPSISTRSPPPKFSSFISRAQTAPAGSSWPRRQEPQSMAMRMATLALEEEADAARQRTPYDDSDDVNDDESESSCEAETDQKLIKTASGSLNELNQHPAGDYSIPDVQVSAPEPVAEIPAKPPGITVSDDECITIAIPVPQINLPGDDDDDPGTDQPSDKPVHSRRPSITISPTPSVHARVQMDRLPPDPPRFMSSAPGSAGVISGSAAALYGVGTSLRCAGCHEPIVGRIVSAMNQRWHPACFKCVVCGELLEHVSSYEHRGRPYCHLDYHEHFAPKCYHCMTPIADERFITLDDPALGGQRYYHELHFFCAECGDPFLDPSKSSAAPRGPVSHATQDEDDVGFTVYKGHPYCQNCHVRLRMPRCGSSLKPGLRLLPGIGCHKPITEGTIEAVGRRWHLECFTCSSCKQPFEDPSFFQRGDQAYCDPCYRIIVKSEL